MNQLQDDILTIIYSIVSIQNFDRMVKDHAVRYGLLNYIAKYSLARNRYYVTSTSLECLQRNNLIKERGLRRGAKISSLFTYEHPIPCNQVGKIIIESRFDRDAIKNILELTDIVTILTVEENERLKANKLHDKMPDGWEFFKSNPFERYIASGICEKPPRQEISVHGSIKR